MPRRVRMEQSGGLYHVINRGNYRRDLFETAGSAEAFLAALFEAADRCRWRVHGYVLMRNHFHLAIETLEPTLGEGMHWLQSTLATRFNRFRSESGHLFQGRYKAMPIEDASALARVVDYIHLNPVRAKVVLPEHLVGYRWSSLKNLLKGPRPRCLCAEVWLSARGGWADDTNGWSAYAEYLTSLAKDEETWAQAGLVGLAKGWIIGTAGWRKSLAKEHTQLRLQSAMAAQERKELREAAWQAGLEEALREIGKSEVELVTKPHKQAWKLALAVKLRDERGAGIAWLAQALRLGKPTTVRNYLHIWKKVKK
ncbi:MAG: transposase [Opitutus sp.]|nr:transposase [Opitutus sp.]MCS6247332.1 transposase [Opitutus sp.]MCS6275284.1 transposase [Opitutus sp.]MCS6277572.1 transposase [Opitutus sp.]MCS6300690.1 transposase [Opitutus sp.]